MQHLHIKYYFLALALVGLLAGCRKFLELDPPKSEIERSVIFSDDITATSAALSIYSTLGYDGVGGGHTTGIMATGGLSADELVNVRKDNLEGMQFERNNLLPANSTISVMWTCAYKVIYQSNTILEGLSKSDAITASLKEQLKGEALCLRAFSYFYLVNIFGDVPIVLTTDYKANSTVPRMPAEQVNAQIASDLLEAEKLLADNYDFAAAERARINAFAAKALLARFYLYHEKWAEAEAKATEVIDQKSLYDLKESLLEVFLKNSNEAILQLYPPSSNGLGETKEGGLFAPDNVLDYFVSREGVNNWFETGDKRMTDWNDTIFTDTDTLYYPFKYKVHGYNQPMLEYSMVIRLAELYLIRAEARAMQDKLTGDNGAIADIDKIRHRAGLGGTPAVSKADVLDAVMQERRVELFAEWGHRWFDLKRTGKAISVLSPLKEAFTADDLLYPVPQSEFIRNPKLGRQNNGY